MPGRFAGHDVVVEAHRSPAMTSRCAICGAKGLASIAAPAARSMLSDGTLVGVPVARSSCRNCGAATLAEASLRRVPRELFGASYRLNAGPASSADIARQAGYASRIAALAGFTPRSVLDVGCGNGALLLALGNIWPSARLAGMEPAPGAAAAARLAGLNVQRTLHAGTRAELIVSINVIEHTPDPLAFVRRLRMACAPGGRVLVICPDAETPWLELMMLDHRHCFTGAALDGLAVRAGFAVLARQAGTDGGFQAILLRPARSHRRTTVWPATRALLAERRRYMGQWRALDGLLQKQRDPTRRLIGFGAGEAARLLRAYAPGIWAAVEAVTADDPSGAQDLGKPVRRMEDVNMVTDDLLLAVRPQAQSMLAARFSAVGGRVLRWDGLVPR